MNDDIIGFENVTKVYRLGHERSNARAALPGRWGEPTGSNSFRAVDDVSFSVRRNEAFGIIGPNGAGKSTVLKILAGSIVPTSGRFWRPRRMVSIIELGLGFDPDLTGLENLASGGALIGMSPGEIRDKQEDIIAFAELESFASMPVKRYSTGMLARLGFALATSAEADVFVIDEVLSVGDWGFQRKSLERVRSLKDAGATIVFVSHNLWVVNQLCERAMLLDSGRAVMAGPTSRVLGAYLGQTPFLADHDGGRPTAAMPETDAIDDQKPDGPGSADDGSADPMSLSRAESGPDSATLPREVMEDPIEADWRPVVIHSLSCEPFDVEPGGPMDLVGVIEVRRAVPGLRLVAGAYWEGFAGFSSPDELPSEFLQEPGWYRFCVHYKSIAGAPAPGTFQIAVVTEDEPDDPEQLLPNAVERRRADMRVVGPVTSRPGVYLQRTWELEALPSAPSAADATSFDAAPIGGAERA